MLIAHKIELRPTPEQAEYLSKACGSRRHCYNQLLAHFSQPEVKWSKTAAYQHYMTVLRIQFPWYSEVSSRVTRNAIDDLDHAFRGFFRCVKAKAKKPGYPQFKKKDVRDSFALREASKFDVDGRALRIEKLKTRIKQAHWRGATVVIADRWFPSSKTCHACGQIQDMPLSQRTLRCDCGNSMDRDLNAALNLNQYGRDALKRDLKRTHESGKTGSPALALTA